MISTLSPAKSQAAKDGAHEGHGPGKCQGHGHSHGHEHDQFFEMYFAAASAALLGIAYLADKLMGPSWPVLFAYVASYFFGAFFATREAISNLKAKRFEIDTLMILAAAGAAILGEWAEGALLLTLFSLGHALENYAMGKAKGAIEALAQLAPKTANVIRKGIVQQIPVEEIVVGDTVVVKPNERFSIDGFVSNGHSSVNQAPVTGESVPVEKSPVQNEQIAIKNPEKIAPQHRIFAGSINGTSAIEVYVTKLAKDSTIARIAKMVTEAQAAASPTQEFTKKLEKYFVPAVLVGVAVLLFAFLVISEPFGASFYRAMAVLVAASPCALAISTPSAVLSGIARAGRSGILIKGGAALENLGRVEAIAFDKTGTLTEGKPRLKDILPAYGVSEVELLQTVAAVEAKSDHPLAQAIVEAAKAQFGDSGVLDAEKVEGLIGKGVKGIVNGKEVLIAKPSVFEKHQQFKPLKEEIWRLQNKGRTVMVASSGDMIIGVLGIMDVPRASAKSSVRALKDLGVKKLFMISGDNQIVAGTVAAHIGIEKAVGDLMPEDKVQTIQSLRNELKGVAMVGDGVNDAPAMAASTVGVAMGSAGSDVALETADVALMTNNLLQLAFAVDLSRKASRIIRQNLWISVGMVLILIPATISGLGIGPAVAMHEGSTVIVVFNALRLLAYRNKFELQDQAPRTKQPLDQNNVPKMR